MTTLQGFTDGSYDYKQMYDIKDLHGCLPDPIIHSDTILGILQKDEKCVLFTNLIKSLPISALYNNIQGNFTLFVPLNINTNDISDSYKIKKLIMFHTLEKALPLNFLQSSRGMYVNTLLSGTRILIENINNQTILNGHSIIIGMKLVGNAIIYYIDRNLKFI